MTTETQTIPAALAAPPQQAGNHLVLRYNALATVFEVVGFGGPSCLTDCLLLKSRSPRNQTGEHRNPYTPFPLEWDPTAEGFAPPPLA